MESRTHYYSKNARGTYYYSKHSPYTDKNMETCNSSSKKYIQAIIYFLSRLDAFRVNTNIVNKLIDSILKC